MSYNCGWCGGVPCDEYPNTYSCASCGRVYPKRLKTKDDGKVVIVGELKEEHWPEPKEEAPYLPKRRGRPSKNYDPTKLRLCDILGNEQLQTPERMQWFKDQQKKGCVCLKCKANLNIMESEWCFQDGKWHHECKKG